MRILVVDDEALLVKGISYNLRNEGYEVLTGATGLDAVRTVREGPVDLVILDVMMPEMDGLEACRQIRAFSDVPIILLTAKEFDLMDLLMRNPNRVYSRENLLDLIWGYDYQGDIRTVDVHIRRIREKLEHNPAEPEHIMTKWGVGYYFKA